MNLDLKRPICFFDLETTGINVASDRIVEICVLKIYPDGKEEVYNQRLNPTIPIPPHTSEIHGIYDEDVKDKPTFKDEAENIYKFFENSDLGGYNSIKFDIPLLVEEFLRLEMNLEIKDRNLVDVQNIFHKMEQRTLAAAYKFYCGKSLENAHSAEADTVATYEILKSQLDRYQEVPFFDNKGNESFPVQNDMNMLHEFSQRNRNADLMGRIVFNDKGQEVFNFGKHKGRPVVDVLENEPSYYNWMLNGDFPLYTKKVLKEIKLKMKFNSLG